MNDPSASEGAPPPTGEVGLSVVEVVNIILRHWRLVVGVPAFLALIVGLWTLGQQRTYVASASFLPQSTEGGRAGGAAALAQQFGLNLGSERPGQSPDFYIDLLRRRTLLRQAVEMPYEIPVEGGTERATLIEWFDIEETGGPLPPWRQAVERLRNEISASVGRQTAVVEVSVSASHPLLAEQIIQQLLDLLHEFNIEVRQRRALEEGRFIAGRLAEVRSELMEAERALQTFLSQNRQFRNSPELVFEHDRLQRQVAMRQEVYTSLLRSQEQAQIDAVRDTPLFMIIDHPAGTAEPEGRGLLLRTLLAFILGLMIAVLVALMTEFISKIREEEDVHYQEFKALVRQARHDLGHPTRWFRRSEKPVAAGDHRDG